MPHGGKGADTGDDLFELVLSARSSVGSGGDLRLDFWRGHARVLVFEGLGDFIGNDFGVLATASADVSAIVEEVGAGGFGFGAKRGLLDLGVDGGLTLGDEVAILVTVFATGKVGGVGASPFGEVLAALLFGNFGFARLHNSFLIGATAGVQAVDAADEAVATAGAFRVGGFVAVSKTLVAAELGLPLSGFVGTVVCDAISGVAGKSTTKRVEASAERAGGAVSVPDKARDEENRSDFGGHGGDEEPKVGAGTAGAEENSSNETTAVNRREQIG